MRSSILLAAVVLALLVAGCAERALGPADVSGVYGLLRYDNDTLPRSYSTGAGCRIRIESGSLVLSSDGTFDLEISGERVCTDSCPSWYGIHASGAYGEVAGRWLALRDDAAGTTYLAWVVGTHIVVKVPQAAAIGGGAVDVEFAAALSWGNQTVAVAECGGLPLPPPDTTTIVVITKRP